MTTTTTEILTRRDGRKTRHEVIVWGRGGNRIAGANGFVTRLEAQAWADDFTARAANATTSTMTWNMALMGGGR